jgi:ribose 5-phosphate isomerase B
MRIALCSDEPYPVHQTVLKWLSERDHALELFGSLQRGAAVSWALAAEEAAAAVASGRCEQGVFFCWTGTGISIAANKLSGVRAALCSDPGQAAAARVWNHANVLCLSNRTLADDMAKEILSAWFETDPGDKGTAGVELLGQVEARHRR